MNENEIVQEALQKLAHHTGMKAKWKPYKGAQDRGIDGELDLNFNNNHFRLFVEVKTELRNYQLPQLFEMAKKHQPFIVVAERIFPTLKVILKEKKIGYLDTAGNICVCFGKNFVYIEGNKLTEEKKPVTNRAFTKTGLKTVFYLLLVPDAINMPYRALAEATNVALGNIKNIIQGLKDAGFILEINNKTLKIQNKKALLERWIAGYKETLKPTLKLGTYKFWDDKKLINWQALPVKNAKMVWGGEPAGEYLTNYLRPAYITIYTDNEFPMITEWTLIPDEKGQVLFYKKFWNDPDKDEQRYAPPLLVYADLLITEDPRCQEAAEMIFKKYLKDEFK
jgi:hypothetical protein